VKLFGLHELKDVPELYGKLVRNDPETLLKAARALAAGKAGYPQTPVDDGKFFVSIPEFWDSGTSPIWSELHAYITVFPQEKRTCVLEMLQIYVKLRKASRHDPPVTFPDPLVWMHR
jgi:hypothetical protein